MFYKSMGGHRTKIKELLTDETKWTQGSGSKDAAGNTVSFTNSSAVCWCIWGACALCYDMSRKSEFYAVWNKLLAKTGNPIVWQDDPKRTFAEVKALVDYLDV